MASCLLDVHLATEEGGIFAPADGGESRSLSHVFFRSPILKIPTFKKRNSRRQKQPSNLTSIHYISGKKNLSIRKKKDCERYVKKRKGFSSFPQNPGLASTAWPLTLHFALSNLGPGRWQLLGCGEDRGRDRPQKQQILR